MNILTLIVAMILSLLLLLFSYFVSKELEKTLIEINKTIKTIYGNKTWSGWITDFS